MSTCALVAAVNFNAEHFRSLYNNKAFDFIIAVDAGFAFLEKLGIQPDMAVGDFDSLGYVPKCRRVSRHPVKKDKSDLELSFEKAVEWNQQNLVVYAALGARLDHTVANLQLFAKYSEAGYRVSAIGDDYAIRLLSGPDVLEIPACDEGTISVLSLSDKALGVIETGMVYAFNDEAISNRTTRGLSNRLRGEDAHVAVEKGTLLVFYPLSVGLL